LRRKKTKSDAEKHSSKCMWSPLTPNFAFLQTNHVAAGANISGILLFVQTLVEELAGTSLKSISNARWVALACIKTSSQVINLRSSNRRRGTGWDGIHGVGMSAGCPGGARRTRTTP
jgi:hypothetical protein